MKVFTFKVWCDVLHSSLLNYLKDNTGCLKTNTHTHTNTPEMCRTGIPEVGLAH